MLHNLPTLIPVISDQLWDQEKRKPFRQPFQICLLLVVDDYFIIN